MYMYFVDEENLKDAKKRGLLHMCTHACAHTHTHTRGLLSGVSPGEHRLLLGASHPGLMTSFMHPTRLRHFTLHSLNSSGSGWVGITEAPGKNLGRK